jgi:hypothetical protein
MIIKKVKIRNRNHYYYYSKLLYTATCTGKMICTVHSSVSQCSKYGVYAVFAEYLISILRNFFVHVQVPMTKISISCHGWIELLYQVRVPDTIFLLKQL